MGIVLGILLAIAVGAFVGYPLFRRAAVGPAPADDIDRSIEERVSRSRRRANASSVRMVCPRCGSRYAAGDRFCGECGASLREGPHK